MSPHYKSLISIFVISIFLSSCTSKVGKFTVISTDNVRGLEYAGVKRDEVVFVEEKSCTHRIYLTRTVVGPFTAGIGWFMPSFDVIIGDDPDDRLTNAVEKSIRSAKKRGVFDADILINASIKEKNIIIPLIYGYKCTIAEGDATSSVIRSKGFLEKK